MASQSPAYEVGTPPSRHGVACKVGQVAKVKKHLDPCWQLPDSPGFPAMSHRMRYCLLFRINRFTNPTLPGQTGKPTPETTGLKTFSGEGGGRRRLPDPSLSHGSIAALRWLWAMCAAHGAGLCPLATAPPLCLQGNSSETQEMNSHFPLPLLFQNSAAFLEESKQNKCDRLKNYWKTCSEHFEGLCWADDRRGQPALCPEGGGAVLRSGPWTGPLKQVCT